jgi:hypothetical protein
MLFEGVTKNPVVHHQSYAVGPLSQSSFSHFSAIKGRGVWLIGFPISELDICIIAKVTKSLEV